MAARMYNLRISNDHSYVTNGLPTGYRSSRASSLGQTNRTGRQRQLRASRYVVEWKITLTGMGREGVGREGGGWGGRGVRRGYSLSL